MGTINVINDFTETHHDNIVYRKGETYPKEGYQADEERVEFLQKVHPFYGVPFLEGIVEGKVEAPKKTQRKSTTKNESEV